MEDCTEAVEEIEGAEDMALNKNARYHRGSCPVPSTDRHFEEPLLKRELAGHASIPASS